MGKRVYADRFQVNYCPFSLAERTNEDGAWHETEAEIARGLAWGEEKARLLKWVRYQMRRRLTDKQRRCIELHYFRGLSFTEIQAQTGISGPSACRIVQRGIERLRVAARVDPPQPAPRLGNLGIGVAVPVRRRLRRVR